MIHSWSSISFNALQQSLQGLTWFIDILHYGIIALYKYGHMAAWSYGKTEVYRQDQAMNEALDRLRSSSTVQYSTALD